MRIRTDSIDKGLEFLVREGELVGRFGKNRLSIFSYFIIGREGFNFFKDSWLDSEMEGGEEAVRLREFKDREFGFSLTDSEEVFWGFTLGDRRLNNIIWDLSNE